MTQPAHSIQTQTVIQLGNPVLRQTAQAIANITDPQVQTWIDELLVTVKESNGVGIAAPQVGLSYALVIIASRPNLRYPQAPVMEPTPLINPRIVAHSEETVKGWEGCLSVPGIRGLVPRYQAITLEYCDRTGQQHQQTFTDFVARIIQHELDHLEGKVFLDRVETTQDLMTEQEYFARIVTR